MRRWGMLWLVAGLVVWGCGGGGGGGGETGTPGGTPPAPSPPSTTLIPPAETPPPPAPAPFTGTYTGTWVSTTTPSAGGGVEVVLADGITATQHWVRFTGSPCYTWGSLGVAITGTQTRGEIRFAASTLIMTLIGTLSPDGHSLTATYTSGCNGHSDAGAMTLVQGPVTRSLNGTPIILTATTMAALTSEVYELAPGNAFVLGLTTAIETTFPTTQTFRQSAGTMTGQGSLRYETPGMVFAYTAGALLPPGTTRGFGEARLLLLLNAVEIGGPVAVAQSMLALQGAQTPQVRSQVVTARIRVKQNGALVLLNRGTGEEVATPVNVLVPGFAGVGEGP